MEVHHHSHASDPDSHRGRKKWTHYFWEFLMLFLAVTLGFFVENQREHFIENQREKQYMRSMIEDLTSDTAQFGINSRVRMQRIKMIDSLVYLLSLSDYKDHLNSIYFFGRSISPPVNIFPNDRTIQQLKSSGGLRLIRKTEVSNGIMAYDQEMRLHLFQLTDELEMRAEYRQLVRNIFDGKVVFRMLQKNKFEMPQNNPPLFKDDPALINALINEAQYFKKADETQVARITEMVKLAEALLKLIKKEYDLD